MSGNDGLYDDLNLTYNCYNFSSNGTRYCLDSEGIYSAPVWVVVILSICYGLLSVTAVGGNALVIWAVFGSRRMRRSSTNFFIANLALADITIGLFSIPFQFQAALLQRWNLPRFMCGFCPFVQILSVNVSIFTLTAIAVDRHRAIVSPLSGSRPSRLRARILIAAIWLLSTVLALPMGLALRVTDVPIFIPDVAGGEILEEWPIEAEEVTPFPLVGNSESEVLADVLHDVHYDWPEELTKPFCSNIGLSTSAMMAYRHTLAAVQYACPLVVISVAYIRVGMCLWGSTAPGTAQRRRDANLLRHKKKVIKMLFIVVALFAFCWLPLQAYNVLQAIIPKINEYKYINIIWFCCDWLAMSNSSCNPIIYGIYSDKFKREFARRFRLSSLSISTATVRTQVSQGESFKMEEQAGYTSRRTRSIDSGRLLPQQPCKNNKNHTDGKSSRKNSAAVVVVNTNNINERKMSDDSSS